jgi:hypothetical protein
MVLSSLGRIVASFAAGHFDPDHLPLLSCIGAGFASRSPPRQRLLANTQKPAKFSVPEILKGEISHPIFHPKRPNGVSENTRQVRLYKRTRAPFAATGNGSEVVYAKPAADLRPA